MPTVRELLISPSRSGKRSLVVQGGGMRGVYSMGALTALEDAGLRNAFDVVVGSSAGAINGAYLLTGQAHEAVDIYVEHLSNRNFVNPFRPWKIVDIDFLVDRALKHSLPLDMDALRNSPTLLEVVLTDAETAEPHIVTNRDIQFDFYEVIRATAALPALYNRRVRVGERFFVDGGAVDAVPVIRALELGATDILAVLTRATGYRRGTHGPFYRLAARLMARGQSGPIKDLMGSEDLLFNQAMAFLEGSLKHEWQARTWVVWPSDPEELVGRTTFDKQELRACAEMGRRDMQSTLEKDTG